MENTNFDFTDDYENTLTQATLYYERKKFAIANIKHVYSIIDYDNNYEYLLNHFVGDCLWAIGKYKFDINTSTNEDLNEIVKTAFELVQSYKTENETRKAAFEIAKIFIDYTMYEL